MILQPSISSKTHDMSIVPIQTPKSHLQTLSSRSSQTIRFSNRFVTSVTRSSIFSLSSIHNI